MSSPVTSSVTANKVENRLAPCKGRWNTLVEAQGDLASPIYCPYHSIL
jgi:hypothetical protein